MTDVNEIIERVIKETGKSEEEIRAKMGERKEKTHGLLSDYGAIYAVAREYGIDLSGNETAPTKLADLKPTSSANVIGRVKTVYSEREFSRKDGSRGRFASVGLADDSGEKRVVLWDQNTAIIGKLRVGDVLYVKNGYVKDNRGQVEVHAGPLTNMVINPPNMSVSLPEVDERIDAIKGLQAGVPSVNIVCRVGSYFPKTEFTRSDGSKGSRATFIGEDESGAARIVLWEPLSETHLQEGDVIRIENGYTRAGMNGEVEVQAGSRSRIAKSDAKLKLKPLPKKKDGTVKIGDIKADMKGLDLEARVMRVYPQKDYSKGKMASLILGDSTGTIRAVLWDERSNVASQLNEGDAVRVKNAYAKANMNQEPEVHLGKYSDLLSDSKAKVPTAGEISQMMTEEKRITDLDSGDLHVKIRGKVTQVEDRPLFYMTCSECGKKVQNIGGEWMCEECGMNEGTPNMMASVIVEDETGNIRATAFKEKAERLLGMDVEEAMNMIGENQDEKAPLAQAREKLAGKEITLVGKTNYNEFSDQLEFIIAEIS
ncbi:MAG: OB-fold nucleic acid binding domain-containing protein [Candidatus Altiarchaeota archaeon]